MKHLKDLRIKYITIPNTLGMNFGPKIMSTFGLFFGLILSHRKMQNKRSRIINKANQYLYKQYGRLAKYAKVKDCENFGRIAIILMTSKSYRLAALHRALPGYEAFKPEKIKWLYKRIDKFIKIENNIVKEFASNLKYTRRWIDKKPGDYSRPLGVPAIEWRVFMKMHLHILEIYYRGSKTIPKWQHGGVSKRGLVTAWESLYRILRNPETKYIYEFDIKGFFDRIVNQDVTKEQGPWYNNFMNKWANSRPSKFSLPPKEKDPVEIKFTAMSSRSHGMQGDRREQVFFPSVPMNREIMMYKTNSYLRFLMDSLKTFDLHNPRLDYWQHYDDVKNAIKGMGLNFDYLMYSEDMYWAFKVPLNEQIERNNKDFKERMKGIPNPYKDLIANNYKLPEPGTTTIKFRESTNEDRIYGREAWKGLNETNRGFPQGANLSPFLSVLQLAKTLGRFPGLIMYMDDGVLFGKSRRAVEMHLTKLKEGLKSIKLEIAEEKSRWAKEGGDADFKFLGVRVKGDSLSSDTRKGTRVTFRKLRPREDMERIVKELREDYPFTDTEFIDQLEKDIKEVYNQTEDGLTPEVIRRWLSKNLHLMTASNRRVAIWLDTKARDVVEAYLEMIRRGWFEKFLNKPMRGITAEQIKERIRANLIDKAFNPSEESQEMKIRLGKDEALLTQNAKRGLYYTLRKMGRVEAPETISTMANLHIMKALRRSGRGKRILKF